MDRQETLKILSTFKAIYPNYYRDSDKATLDAAINVWQALLEDHDYATVSNAVMAFVSTDTKGFPPTPGMIINVITKMQQGQKMTEADAWRHVRVALKNSRYGSQQEYEKLPELVRRCVGSADQLKNWAEVPVDELDTVVASNFMRSFRVRSESDREFLALPQKVRQFMELASQKMLEG